MTGPGREDATADAARWQARLRAPDVTEGDRARFRQWLEADPRHAAAWARVRDVDAALSAARKDPRLRALLDEARAMPPEPVIARPGHETSRRVPLALAASLVLMAMSAMFASRNGGTAMALYENDTRAQQQIALADGSVVHLDVGSSVRVEYAPRARRVELLAGRAVFDVARDARRPFAVDAQGTRTVALGTRFEVCDRLCGGGDEVVITLAEGKVSVSGQNESRMWQETLVPGERLSAAVGGGLPLKRSIDVEQALSWSAGRHVFRGTPLHEVLREVNRYSTRQIRIEDASLRDLAVGGSFHAGDSIRIVAALEAILPVEGIVDDNGDIRLVRREGSFRR